MSAKDLEIARLAKELAFQKRRADSNAAALVQTQAQLERAKELLLKAPSPEYPDDWEEFYAERWAFLKT